MELPTYIHRPLNAAAARGLYHGQLVIGYVAPTMTAWFAELDDAGEIVDAYARIYYAEEYREWARRLECDARRQGEELAVVELDDDAVASALQHSEAVH